MKVNEVFIVNFLKFSLVSRGEDGMKRSLFGMHFSKGNVKVGRNGSEESSCH